MMYLGGPALGAFDLALLIFSKRQDDFERLVAGFAIILITGHSDLRRTQRARGSN